MTPAERLLLEFVGTLTKHAYRITDEEAEMLLPADLIELPKGQAFALLDGGKLYKLRLPLPGNDPLLPAGMVEIAAGVRSRYGMETDG